LFEMNLLCLEVSSDLSREKAKNLQKINIVCSAFFFKIVGFVSITYHTSSINFVYFLRPMQYTTMAMCGFVVRRKSCLGIEPGGRAGMTD
jgi:hypothetical protein